MLHNEDQIIFLPLLHYLFISFNDAASVLDLYSVEWWNQWRMGKDLEVSATGLICDTKIYNGLLASDVV